MSSVKPKASKYKILKYAKVKNPNLVKQAIYRDKAPVMLNYHVYDSFFNTGKDGIVKANSGADNGYHCMTIVGFKKIKGTNYFIVQNSWGTSWGDKGYCYIPFTHKSIDEMWTITDGKNTK
jgi:C1A family cysteine protease